MRVLIFGAAGMMGHKAVELLAARFSVFATLRSRPPEAFRRIVGPKGDLVENLHVDEPGDVARILEQVRPDVVINCVAVIPQRMDDIDAAEVILTNSVFPHRLAGGCGRIGARLIHMSTDGVFSGRRGGYAEDDLPDAKDLYGRSKLLGEPLQPHCLAIRTAIVGRSLTGDRALLDWLTAQSGGRVPGYRNALFSGVSTIVLAEILGEIIEHHRNLGGVYHLASEPLSKYELLCRFRDAADIDVEIDPADLPQAIDRSLDGRRFVEATGIRVPNWDAMIGRLAQDAARYG